MRLARLKKILCVMKRNNIKKSWVSPQLCCRIAVICLVLGIFIFLVWMMRPATQPSNAPENFVDEVIDVHSSKTRTGFGTLKISRTKICKTGDISEINELWDKIVLLKDKCPTESAILGRMFKISRRHGKVVFPTSEYKKKVQSWLGNDEELFKRSHNQSILSVYNLYTYEHIVFNPLRSLRPISPPDMPEKKYIEAMTVNTSKSCDFCNYKNMTGRDESGRLETDLSATAANTFRYDAKHQLVMPKTHDPIKWTRKQLVDMFNLALKWANQTYTKTPEYSYPHIMWDLLPHAGASQVHPHLQIVLLPDQYPGVAESWRSSADRYNTDHAGFNYYTDLLQVHESLGLTARYKSAIAFASLTPKKDNEIVILSKEADEDHFNLLYMVLRTFIDDMKIYPFSLGMSIPQLYDKRHQTNNRANVIPAVTRVVTRGLVSEIRSDISSLELFSFYNVNSDPFKLIKKIKNRLTKESRPTKPN